MGQKCSATSLRVGLNKPWLSRWNPPNKETAIKWLLEDEKVRKYINKEYKLAGIGLVEIERSINWQNQLVFNLFVHVAQIGLILGSEKVISAINKDLKRLLCKKTIININILELKNPGVSANILVKDLATDLENRLPFRSSMKRILKKAKMSGAQGIKIKVTGRLNGAEMARSESYSEGEIPLSTLRADIDYCQDIAQTKYGVIGIKIWINRGLYFGKYFIPLPKEHKKTWGNNKFIPKNY